MSRLLLMLVAIALVGCSAAKPDPQLAALKQQVETLNTRLAASATVTASTAEASSTPSATPTPAPTTSTASSGPAAAPAAAAPSPTAAGMDRSTVLSRLVAMQGRLDAVANVPGMSSDRTKMQQAATSFQAIAAEWRGFSFSSVSVNCDAARGYLVGEAEALASVWSLLAQGNLVNSEVAIQTGTTAASQASASQKLCASGS